jgi:hypothetical protein
MCIVQAALHTLAPTVVDRTQWCPRKIATSLNTLRLATPDEVSYCIIIAARPSDSGLT